MMQPDRFYVQNRFAELITNLSLRDKFEVAVVGGTKEDTEIKQLYSSNRTFTVKTLGIENSDYYFDLNQTQNFDLRFDLVLSSHVFEHIWNLPTAISNLKRLLKPQAYLWVNVPASNRKHGSPGYYSSGYSADMLRELFKFADLSVIECMDIGTQRNYNYVHLFQRWPTSRDLTPNLLKTFQVEQLNNNVLKQLLSHAAKSLIIRRWSTQLLSDSKYSTETYGLAQNL